MMRGPRSKGRPHFTLNACIAQVLPHAATVRVLRHRHLASLLSQNLRNALWKKLGVNIDSYAVISPAGVITGDFPKVTIGRGTYINGARLIPYERISIGRNVLLSPGAILLTASHNIDSADFRGKLGPILIGDYVWIALDALILPGVTIGEGAVVGARAVVSRDVPPYAVVAGNPAVVVRQRKREPFTYIPAAWVRPGGHAPGQYPPGMTEHLPE